MNRFFSIIKNNYVRVCHSKMADDEEHHLPCTECSGTKFVKKNGKLFCSGCDYEVVVSYKPDYINFNSYCIISLITIIGSRRNSFG